MAGTSLWVRTACIVVLGLSIEVSAEPPDAKDPFFLSNPRKDTITTVEAGLSGYGRGSSDDLKAGWGGMALLDVVRWQPLVIRFDFSYSFTHTIAGVLPDVPIHTMEADVSVMFRAMSDPLQPYIGGGASWVGNIEPADEHLVTFVPGGYEDFGPPNAYDMGKGFGFHMRAGLGVRVAGTTRLILDVKYLSMTPKVEFTYTEWPSGRTFTRSVPYDYNTVHISLGVTVGLSQSKN